MKYNYYKDKYKTVSIKLDKQKDQDVIEYFQTLPPDIGPKEAICGLIRSDIAMLKIIAMYDPSAKEDSGGGN